GTVPTSLAGASDGRNTACGRASLNRNSESGRLRLMVTVPAARSATTPPSSVQVAGVARQAPEPTITLKKEPEVGLDTLKMRWNEATTSSTSTSLPSENLIPL